MTDLPKLAITRGAHTTHFHGSWYRGQSTNFIPSKAEIRSPGAVDRFVMHGWAPQEPFLTKQHTILAFGSCFAAHVSNFLRSNGYNVAGADLNLQSHIIRFGEGIVNTFAIRQQIEWALKDKPMQTNLWFGPNKEVCQPDPAICKETADLIRSAEVLIVTAGLSEIWYDKRTGEAFWRAIPRDMFDPEIHGFRVSTIAENRENLEVMLAAVRESRPDIYVILTLSPVPLMATFRPVSCITASAVSKAVLRVAIDEFMRGHADDDRLFYFPSYELVTSFFPDPFIEDNRHPKPPIIQFVMSTFRRHYCL